MHLLFYIVMNILARTTKQMLKYGRKMKAGSRYAKTPMYINWQNSHYKRVVLPKTIYRFSAIPIHTSNIFFNHNKTLKLIKERKSPKSQCNSAQ